MNNDSYKSIVTKFRNCVTKDPEARCILAIINTESGDCFSENREFHETVEGRDAVFNIVFIQNGFNYSSDVISLVEATISELVGLI